MPAHTLSLPDININPVEIERGMLDFDMHLWVVDQPDGLTSRLEYRNDLYSKSTAEQFLSRFKIILNQLLTDLDGPLSQCDGLAKKERRWLLDCLSPPIEPTQFSQSVLDVWRHISQAYSTNTALTCGEFSISYEQLDHHSDQLAAALLVNGVRSGDVIALYLQPGIAMTVAMLACVKSGIAYLPIEVGIPDERLAFMLTDSSATLIITEATFRPTLNSNIPMIDLLSSGMPMIEAELPTVWPTVRADDLAYVMYTSGSTGTPKGVRVPHRAIVRLVKNTNYIQIQPNDRIGQVSNSAFDAFTFEIWGALLKGATAVCIARETVLDPKRLGDCLIDK
jgi:non-ribosomal peptide synthetase component F